MELLDRAAIANAGVNSVAEFLDHPVLTERDRWRDVAVPGAPRPGTPAAGGPRRRRLRGWIRSRRRAGTPSGSSPTWDAVPPTSQELRARGIVGVADPYHAPMPDGIVPTQDNSS